MTKQYPSKQYLSEVISNREFAESVPPEIVIVMARQLLASMEQEPVAWQFKERVWVKGLGHVWKQRLEGENPIPEGDPACDMIKDIMPLYAAPQLPQPAVPDYDALRLAFEATERKSEYGFNLQKYGIGYADEATQLRWEQWVACRAAMLQGAEPVSQPYTLREGLAAIRSLGGIDVEKIQAERDALNEPDVPDGYALVPLEPTAEMVAAAMLSNDVLFDQDDDTMFRVQHGVIWRAMLAAAPDFREISNSSTKHFLENAETSTKCWCLACRPVTMNDARFVVCPDCGNKRCPHANDHRNACTGSNEPGQEGSAYPAEPQQE